MDRKISYIIEDLEYLINEADPGGLTKDINILENFLTAYNVFHNRIDELKTACEKLKQVRQHYETISLLVAYMEIYKKYDTKHPRIKQYLGLFLDNISKYSNEKLDAAYERLHYEPENRYEIEEIKKVYESL